MFIIFSVNINAEKRFEGARGCRGKAGPALGQVVQRRSPSPWVCPGFLGSPLQARAGAISGLMKPGKERNILIVIKVSENVPEWIYLTMGWK